MDPNRPGPPPRPNSLAAVWDLVIADMKNRDQHGLRKYGTRLQPFNGRDPLIDAYQEALDLVVYLRQAIAEKRASASPTRDPEGTMADQGISELFAEIVGLCEALGVSKINQIEGCWEHELGDGWRVAVNGHGEDTATSWGASVPPYHALIEADGWPVALLHPRGGMAMGPDGEAEAEAIERVRGARDLVTRDPEGE